MTRENLRRAAARWFQAMAATVCFAAATAATAAEYTLTAVSADDAKGSVEVGKGAAEPGEAFAATAVPADGYAFAYWTGDLPERCKYCNPLSLPARASYAIQAVFGPVAYVAPEAPAGSAEPYGTIETAAGTVQDAIAAVGAAASAETPAVVVLAPGRYTGGNFLPETDDDGVANEFMLPVECPVVLRSASGSMDDTVVFDGEGTTRKFVHLNVPGAALVGVTVSNANYVAIQARTGTVANVRVTRCAFSEKKQNDYQQLVRLISDQAAIHDCEITGNTSQYYAYSNPGALAVSGGAAARRCRVTDNSAITLTGQTWGAAGVFVGSNSSLRDSTVIGNKMIGGQQGNTTCIAGGIGCYGQTTIENCVVAGNSVSNSGPSAGGVIVLGGDRTAKLVNCTIAGNSIHHVWLGNGKTYACQAVCTSAYFNYGYLVNCILDSDGTSEYDLVPAPRTTATYSLFSGGAAISGTGNSTGTVYYVDAANGDYRLRLYSDGIDAGSDAAVASEEDLAGEPRIAGAAVDAGAHEIQPEGRVEIWRERTCFAVGSSVTVMAAVDVAPQSGEAWTWTLSKDGKTVDSGKLDSEGTKSVSWPIVLADSGTYDLRVSVALADGGAAEDAVAYSVFGNVAYVSAEGSGTEPYDSWETAAHSLRAATELLGAIGAPESKATVFVAPGVYAPGEEAAGDDYAFDIPGCMIVKGCGESPADTILDAAGMRGVRLAPGARIENLTVTGCKATGQADFAYGIRADNAEVVGCVLSGGTGIDYMGTDALAEFYVDQYGGLFRDFTLEGASGWCPWRLAEGARTENAIVENCGSNAVAASGWMRCSIVASGAGTVISNLTYSGNCLCQRNNGSSDGAITLLNGAELVDSVLSDNVIDLRKSTFSSALIFLQVTSGTLRRTKVIGTRVPYVSGVAGGARGIYPGVYLKSGLLDNCLVASNIIAKTEVMRDVTQGNRRMPGVYMSGGIVSNSTIVANCSCLESDVHGVNMAGGAIVNSIIAANGYGEGCVQLAKASASSADVRLQTFEAIVSGVSYTLVGDAGELNPEGEGVQIGDPLFRRVERGDYHPLSSSPARRAGTMAAEASLDLDGEARPAGRCVDLGCYVIRGRGLRMVIR